MFCLRPAVRTCRLVPAAFSSTACAHKQEEPIEMAYASYEKTDNKETGLPLFIMHGLFGNKANWNSLCKAMQRNTKPHRKVVAVDARNHGDSPHTMQHSYPLLADDIKHFLDKMRVEKAALLGHSMGGRAMMYFTLKYPEMVERLIIADISPVRTSPSLNTMPPLLDLLGRVRLPKSGTMSQSRVVVDRQLINKINDKGLRQFILTNLVQKSDGSFGWRMNLASLTMNFENVANFPDPQGLQYDGPVLFVAGGASDFLTAADQPKILKIFPNAAFEYIPGAGHWVHSEKPNEFLKVVLEFLNK